MCREGMSTVVEGVRRARVSVPVMCPFPGHFYFRRKTALAPSEGGGANYLFSLGLLLLGEGKEGEEEATFTNVFIL